jgi:hypothetical protein
MSAVGTVQYTGAANPHTQEVDIAGYQNFIINATPGQILTLPVPVCSYLVGVQPNWWATANEWTPPPAGPASGFVVWIYFAYTIQPSNAYVFADPTSGGSFTVALPDATSVGGFGTLIKHVGSANTITIQPAGGQTIDGAPSKTVAVGGWFGIYSDGTATWRIVSVPGANAGGGSFTSPQGTITNAGTGSALELDVASSVVLESSAAPGNMGSAYTLPFSGARSRMVRGTLDANLVITVSPINAGYQALVTLVQNGTGGWSLTVSDGATSSLVSIATAPEASTQVLISCTDGTTVDVQVLSSSGSVGGGGGGAAANAMQGPGTTVTTAGTVSYPTELLNATSAVFTRTLPTAVGFSGVYVLDAITTNTNLVTINTTDSQTIDGYVSGALMLGSQASGAPYQAVTLVSDGSNWRIIY